MEPLPLKPTERHIAIAALRVAAVQYAIDAQTSASCPRIQAQFLKQAEDAMKLATDLENAS